MAESDQATRNFNRLATNCRLLLLAGCTDVTKLIDELIAIFNEDAADRSGRASKAFQAAYQKAGAIESGANALTTMNKSDFAEFSWCANLRRYLDVVAASFRESPDVVIGAKALADKQRVTDGIAALTELKERLRLKVIDAESKFTRQALAGWAEPK